MRLGICTSTWTCYKSLSREERELLLFFPRERLVASPTSTKNQTVEIGDREKDKSFQALTFMVSLELHPLTSFKLHKSHLQIIQKAFLDIFYKNSCLLVNFTLNTDESLNIIVRWGCDPVNTAICTYEQRCSTCFVDSRLFLTAHLSKSCHRNFVSQKFPLEGRSIEIAIRSTAFYYVLSRNVFLLAIPTRS